MSKNLELDPNGLDQHQSGAKLDAGKPRCGLVLGDFHSALLEVSKVGTYGADKYTESGWKDVPNGISRYEDAMLRHWLEYKDGNFVDEETGLLHLAQMCWNGLAMLQLHFKTDESYEGTECQK